MQQYEQEIHLSEYLRILKNRKWMVLLFFLFTVTAVTVGSFLMEPVYRATVTLFIDVESPNILTTSGSVELASTNYYVYKEYFQSQKEIIMSRSIAKQVFGEFKLYKSRDYARSKDMIEDFLETIKVEPVRDTRLLLLHVDNKNSKLAAAIANRIADIYVARNLHYISKSEVMNLRKNEYLKLQAKLSEYSKIYKEKHPKMIRLKQEISQMVARIKDEKEVLNSYDFDKATDSAVLTGLKANNITIQDRADPPKLPLKPKKRLNILLSVIVGLFGGIGIAFFFEYLDDTIKSPEDLERFVKWPFLGSIPRMDGSLKVKEIEKNIFTDIQPKDPISEAYRTIRTSVFFSSTEERPLKSIVITSPGPQEGKTTTFCNLGIVMAQNNKKVLLVDADMRKPMLHDIFKKSINPGISNFLSGQAEFNDIVHNTRIKDVSIVCGGHHPPNPSELLSSRKMKEFISMASEKFDIILFDTAPMAVVTDAIVLSRSVDGTIIVLESGRTSRNILPRMNQLLHDSHARVIGALLNKISINSGDYYYYSYYYGKKNK